MKINNRVLTVVAVLGLSVSSAQAVTLNYEGSHTADFQMHTYEFNNLSAGNVSIWTDTIKDGFDNRLSLFVKNDAQETWDYSGLFKDSNGQVQRDNAFNFDGGATEPRNADNINITGKNNFGVAMKNGFVLNDPLAKGISDDGRILENLPAGQYLLTLTDQNYKSAGNDAIDVGQTVIDTFEDGFYQIPGGRAGPRATWSTGWDFSTGGVASPFKLFIEGNVAENNVSAVPVPAAIWLFGSALAGLSVAGRKKAKQA